MSSLWGLLFGIKMDIILSVMKFFSKMFYCCGWYGIFLKRSVVSETKCHCGRFSRNERAKTNNKLSDSIWDKVHGRWDYICVNWSFYLQTCLPFESKNCLSLRDMKCTPSPTFSMKMLIFISMKLGNKGTDITLHYGTCVITIQVWFMRKQKSCKDCNFTWIVLRGNAIVLVSRMKECMYGIDYNGQALLYA